MGKMERQARQLLRRPALRALARKAGNPLLWRLTERTMPRAAAIGLFTAWIPIPGQMVVAAAAAIYFNANLPVAVGLVWVSNPLTWVPLAYLAYYVGALLMDIAPVSPTLLFDDGGGDADLASLSLGGDFLAPLLLGSTLLGVISASIGFSVAYAIARSGGRMRRWLDARNR